MPKKKLAREQIEELLIELLLKNNATGKVIAISRAAPGKRSRRKCGPCETAMDFNREITKGPQ